MEEEEASGTLMAREKKKRKFKEKDTKFL